MTGFGHALNGAQNVVRSMVRKTPGHSKTTTLKKTTMIHYHGLPITPATAALRAISGGHAFVSFRHPEQLTIALEVAQSFAVDNGAVSAWRSGTPVTDWSLFYEWGAELHR